MEKIQIFKGEPVEPGSSFTSENEATMNAGFGAYNYDPAMRLSMQQQQPNPVYLPGWQGYSTSQNAYGVNNNNFTAMNPPTGYYMSQQPIGLGANPYLNNYNYNPYMMGGNPALNNNNGFNFNYQTTPQQQNFTVHIPGVNFGGEYLPLVGYEDKIAELEKDFWIKEQEFSVKQALSNNGYNNMYGYNYYGYPYYNNSFGYSSLRSEADKIIRDMQEEARENRRLFNIRMAKLAHNIAGDKYDESVLEEMYTGKDITNPYGITMPELYTQNRFSNLVPFDNSYLYANHSLAVSSEYSSIIRPDSNMKECFDNMGIVAANYELEEEAHRRKNCTNMYDASDSGYRYFVKKKAAERLAGKNNGMAGSSIAAPQYGSTTVPTSLTPNINIARNSLNQFPSLSSSASLSDDGTLTIGCNFGSKKGTTYSVNANEAKYNEDRARFNAFLSEIPNFIYLDKISGGNNK